MFLNSKYTFLVVPLAGVSRVYSEKGKSFVIIENRLKQNFREQNICRIFLHFVRYEKIIEFSPFLRNFASVCLAEKAMRKFREKRKWKFREKIRNLKRKCKIFANIHQKRQNTASTPMVFARKNFTSFCIFAPFIFVKKCEISWKSLQNKIENVRLFSLNVSLETLVYSHLMTLSLRCVTYVDCRFVEFKMCHICRL